MIHKSPLPSVTIPEKSVLDRVFTSASPSHKLSTDPLWIDADDDSNYASLHSAREWVKRLGCGLQKRGLGKGDVVLVFTPNHIFVPIGFLGALASGAAFSGSNPSFTVHELAYQLQKTKAKILFVHPSLLKTALEAAKQVGLPKRSIFLFSDRSVKPVEEVQDFRTMLASEDEARNWSWKHLSLQELRAQTATVNFSTGTTGFPKGVMATHYNLVANITQIIAHMDIKRTPNYPWLDFLPLYHAYGQFYFVLVASAINQPVLVMRSFALDPFLSLVQKYKIRQLHCVPPVLVMLHKRPEVSNYDLTSVKSIMCGAAPLSKEVEVAVATKHGWRYLGGFGMTELYCMGMANGDHLPYHAASIGLLLPNMEMRIVDDNGKDVDGYGEKAVGELYLKGPQVAKGYWENEEATRETFGGGWLKTGDIGYVTKEGFIWLVDRKKELIKHNGLQVSPAELEAVLLENDHVFDAAVVGLVTENNELPRAYVSLKETSIGKVTEQDIQSWLKTRVAKHKWLTGGVAFVPVVPRFASGKIQRKLVREWAKRDEKAGVQGLDERARARL
ncbi:4-coumarate-CoA ligase [Xylogone sp. PMI_703]|nr:4-coumarate-CoA ligase [Xylogone sp. PMI_703]